MTEEQLIAGDHRRAAALIAHDLNNNMTGIDAVLQEAAEAGRIVPLIHALLNVFGGIITPIHGPWFDAGLTGVINRMARKENG